MNFHTRVFRLVLLLVSVILTGVVTAQPPAAVNFQAIAKDPQNNPARNRTVYVKDAIYQTTPSGTLVWSEAHVVTTDADGLFTIIIGRGTKDPAINIPDISKIDWANGPFFFNIKTAVAPVIPAAWWVAADNYVDLGTTQILSSFYAIYAGNASVTNVTTSIPPGPNNTFLITDSSGKVAWQTPQAAQQAVTTVTNITVNFQNIPGLDINIAKNTTSTVTIKLPGVKIGDPILVTPLGDYPDWSVYASWVPTDDIIKIRFANFTDSPVTIFGSQYKIVVIK